MCEISALAQKTEQILENFNTTLNNFKQNDDRNTNMVRNNVSFLQQTARTAIKGHTNKITKRHSNNGS